MTGETLSDAARSLLRDPLIAHLATVNDDGSPHVSPIWIDIEGGEIVVNSAEGRRKVRNMRSRARVAISIADPHTPDRALVVEGTVIRITDEGAELHRECLARKYGALDTYKTRRPGGHRVKISIRPDRVLVQPHQAS